MNFMLGGVRELLIAAYYNDVYKLFRYRDKRRKHILK